VAYQEIDCASWDALMTAVMQSTHRFDSMYSSSAVPFFRGHSSARFELLPGLYRRTSGQEYKDYDEMNFYYEFRARSGSLLSPGYGSWDILFLMQHHGVPTRLLDWTESFATALFFALEGASSDVDIWMLDPYLLNQQEANTQDILDVENLPGDYFDLFVKNPRTPLPPGQAVAIYPRRQIARLASQHGLFTLHFSRAPLEEHPAAPWLTRFRLQGSAVTEASRFLKVMGVNEFSLFPDLDGLSRYLRKRIKGGHGIVA